MKSEARSMLNQDDDEIKAISLDKLFEVYLDTVERATSDIRNRQDEEILYDLYEQFDTGAWSFFHEDTLANLRQGGCIDDEMVALSKEARERWLKLFERDWTVAEIKTNPEWQKLFEICDRLKLKTTRK